MKTNKFFIYLVILLSCLFIFCLNVFAQDDDDNNAQQQPVPTTVIKAQPVSPQFDNSLTGEWWTDSKDAIFAKIVFDANGGFTGYNLSTDFRPYAIGIYRIANNGIEITSNDATMGTNKPTPNTYKFVSYTVTGHTLQLVSEVTDKAYNYYRSPSNK